MSAQALQISTHTFPDPSINPIAYDQSVAANISYTYNGYNDMRTLSTNSATPGYDRTGFLYVPQLDATDACLNASSPYVPSNVTRIHDLPQAFQMIAMAPWISPDCTLSYLQRAKDDRVAGFIFFIPNSTDGTPPTTNDAAWGLGDGGQWKKNNPYPVYAISAPAAEAILTQSSLYSGNTSSAPHGPELTALYGDRSYVRLFVDIDTAARNSGIPSIWVFLLIILAVLLCAVGLVSGSMHLIQRRRRLSLQRRVADGEIDLEALGIKRLTVPQELIDKMPVYAYGARNAPEPTPTTLDTPKQDLVSASPDHQEPALAPLYQPTCAICLDDYVPQETNVRELPCRHIFHPACCDTFLRENSSLCPLCKRSALPKGFCPTNISNIMVRRERDLRRRRRRGDSIIRTTSASAYALDTQPAAPAETGNASTEMEVLNSATVPPAATPSRREWARRRALAMIGPRAPADEDETQRQGGSRPRKFLRSIFPGIF